MATDFWKEDETLKQQAKKMKATYKNTKFT